MRIKIYLPCKASIGFNVIGRFGMVIFAAAGRVGSQVADVLSFQNMKTFAGNRDSLCDRQKRKTKSTIDFGVGNNSNGFYFNLIEAF